MDTGHHLRCPQCGYDVFGIPEHRCPECGFGFEHAAILDLARQQLRTERARARHAVGRAALALCWAVAALIVLLLYTAMKSGVRSAAGAYLMLVILLALPWFPAGYGLHLWHQGYARPWWSWLLMLPLWYAAAFLSLLWPTALAVAALAIVAWAWMLLMTPLRIMPHVHESIVPAEWEAVTTRRKLSLWLAGFATALALVALALSW